MGRSTGLWFLETRGCLARLEVWPSSAEGDTRPDGIAAAGVEPAATDAIGRDCGLSRDLERAGVEPSATVAIAPSNAS